MTENQDFGCGKVRQSPRMVYGVVLWDTQGLPHIAALFYDFYGRKFDNFWLFLVLRVKSRFLGAAKCGNHPEWSMGVLPWDTQGLPHIAALFYNFYGRNFDNFCLFLVLRVKMTDFCMQASIPILGVLQQFPLCSDCAIS